MTTTSPRVLNMLAAAVWIIGGLVLLFKSGSLLLDAFYLQPAWFWPGVAAGGGLLIGVIKAHFIFRKSCHKNISRIANLPNPRLWQFFSPRFFMFLALMITAGATLSRLAAGSYVMLLGMAALDLTIGVALLGSCSVFWQRQAFQPA